MKTISILIFTILCWSTAFPRPAISVEIGQPMPDFAFESFDGAGYSRETLEGKPLLLVFWNTWCPNCRHELPLINRLAEEYGPRGLTVLAVNTAINDTESKAMSYWESSGYVFPSTFDRRFELRQAFGVLGVPTIFLIDSKGIIRYKQAKVPDDMDQQFKSLRENE